MHFEISSVRSALVGFAVLAGIAGTGCASEGATTTDQNLTAPSNDQALVVAAVHEKLDPALHAQSNEYVIERYEPRADGQVFFAAELHGTPSPIDWTNTDYKHAIDTNAFAFSGDRVAHFSVLLQKSASTGAYQLVDLVVAPTDGSSAGE